MNKSLLDTDTLSEIGKGKHAGIAAKAKAYRKAFGFYSFSTVSVLEIVRGYQKAQQFQRMHAFMAGISPRRGFPLRMYPPPSWRAASPAIWTVPASPSGGQTP